MCLCFLLRRYCCRFLHSTAHEQFGTLNAQFRGPCTPVLLQVCEGGRMNSRSQSDDATQWAMGSVCTHCVHLLHDLGICSFASRKTDYSIRLILPSCSLRDGHRDKRSASADTRFVYRGYITHASTFLWFAKDGFHPPLSSKRADQQCL